MTYRCYFFFFKQKTAYEIRDVTGVQTCALPIYRHLFKILSWLIKLCSIAPTPSFYKYNKTQFRVMLSQLNSKKHTLEHIVFSFSVIKFQDCPIHIQFY